MLKKYDGTNWNTASYGKVFSGTEQFTNFPLVIRSLDQSVQAYTIKGNTETSGTPSSVEIDGVGVKTANLLNYKEITSNSYVTVTQIHNGINAVGSFFCNFPVQLDIGDYVKFMCDFEAISGTPSLYVRIKYKDGTYSDSITRIGGAVPITKEVDLGLLYISNGATVEVDITNMMLYIGTTTIPYEPFGFKISIYNNGTALSPMYLNNPLRKSLDGTAFDTLDSTGLVTYNVDKYGAPLVTPTTQSVTAPTISTATSGTTVISFVSQVQPSEVSLTYNGKHLNKSKKFSVGNNLIPYPYYQGDGTVAGVTWTTYSDGRIVGTGKTKDEVQFKLADSLILSSGTYTISITGTHTGMSLLVRNKDNHTQVARIQGHETSPVTFTISEEGRYEIYYNVLSYNVNVDIDCYIMLNLGSSALPYEPYGSWT